MSGIFKNSFPWLCALLLLGALLHFYNLNWGAPYYFHPDERNIASSISQLHFPKEMNPNFFAYGSLPIYTIYFTGVLTHSVSHCWTILPKCLPTDMSFLTVFQTPTWSTIATVTFEQAIVISRFYSALFATLLILLLYKIGSDIYSPQAGLLAAFFATMSVGLTQFAHFGTFEMWLTFFGTLLAYACIKIITSVDPLYFLFATLLAGILVAIKISSLVLLPLPLIAFFLSYQKGSFRKITKVAINIGRTILVIVPMIFFAGIVYFATNPFVYFDFHSFRSSMDYESKVALGTLPVFYTQEFYQATPVVFQFLHIYPFLLNPLLTILFIPAFLYFTYQIFKTKNYSYLILYTSYLILFLSQSFLFVKWTRYMMPTLPFMYVMIAVTLCAFLDFLRKHIKQNLPYEAASIFILTICVVFTFFSGIAYFIVALQSPDTRVAARNWAKLHVPKNAPAIAEIYDMGIVPFNDLSNQIVLCDFYTVETNTIPCNGTSLSSQLDRSNYIILASQRIWKVRLNNPQKYPEGNKFYQSLFNEKLGFHKVYETPCNIWCRIVYHADSVFSFEQTANVFDRPTVMIYEKNY